jgi:archaellin
MVDPGEQVDMTVTLSRVTPNGLEESKEFTIQVKPNKGAVVIVNRTTLPEFKAVQAID